MSAQNRGDEARPDGADQPVAPSSVGGLTFPGNAQTNARFTDRVRNSPIYHFTEFVARGWGLSVMVLAITMFFAQHGASHGPYPGRTAAPTVQRIVEQRVIHDVVVLHDKWLEPSSPARGRGQVASVSRPAPAIRFERAPGHWSEDKQGRQAPVVKSPLASSVVRHGASDTGCGDCGGPGGGGCGIDCGGGGGGGDCTGGCGPALDAATTPAVIDNGGGGQGCGDCGRTADGRAAISKNPQSVNPGVQETPAPSAGALP